MLTFVWLLTITTSLCVSTFPFIPGPFATSQISMAYSTTCPTFQTSVSYKKMIGTGWIADPVPLSTTKATSVLMCGGFCTQYVACRSFDFSSATGLCRLYNFNPGDTDTWNTGGILIHVMEEA